VQQLIEKEFGRIPAGTSDAGEPAVTLSLSALNNSNGAPHAPASTAAAAAAAASALHLQCHGSNPLPPAVVLADAADAAASNNGEGGADEPPLVKVRHPVRPPVAHKHGYGPMAPGEGPAAVSVFKHPLLQSFMLSVFCKLPVTSMTTMDDLRKVFMVSRLCG
jgi:hypothetical protein